MGTEPNMDLAPLRFGVVIPHKIYRSQYPQPEDYNFFQSLNLRTILTLVTKASPEFEDFISKEGIEHIVIPLPSNKHSMQMQYLELKQVLELVMDEYNYPLLIHCNKGMHRTGVVSALVGRVVGKLMPNILQGYRDFAGEKIRPNDLTFIGEFPSRVIEVIAQDLKWSASSSITSDGNNLTQSTS